MLDNVIRSCPDIWRYIVQTTRLCFSAVQNSVAGTASKLACACLTLQMLSQAVDANWYAEEPKRCTRKTVFKHGNGPLGNTGNASWWAFKCIWMEKLIETNAEISSKPWLPEGETWWSRGLRPIICRDPKRFVALRDWWWPCWWATGATFALLGLLAQAAASWYGTVTRTCRCFACIF